MNQPNLAKTERILHLCKQAPINKWSFWAYLQSRFFSCSLFSSGALCMLIGLLSINCLRWGCMRVTTCITLRFTAASDSQRNQAVAVRQWTASLWLLLCGKSDCNSLITCVWFHTRECHRTVILSFCLYNTITIIYALLFWHFTAELKKNK